MGRPEPRPLQLVTLDLDGTLIRSTVFEAVARGLGDELSRDVEAYDRLYFGGTLSLEATYYVEYDLFLGRDLEEVHAALEGSTDWVRGIADTVRSLRERGLDVWLVTDQPSWATSFLARWGLRDGVWTEASVRGWEVGAIVRQVFDKWPALEQRLARAGVPPGAVCHVGNGANDVPIFRHVGRAIAFNPSGPEVTEAADVVVHGDELSAILNHVGRWSSGEGQGPG